CDALLFIVTFILSGFIEIFVLFAGFIAFYVFLFAKNPLSKKRDITYAGLFAFTILIFSSFFIVNKGMIAAKYDQKAQRTEASPSTQKPIASMLPATKTISILAQNFVQLTVQTSAQSQPTKKSSTAKSFFQKNSSFFYRLGPWCKYNAKFVKQEIRKIVSFHNLPLMLFLFWILEKTPLKKTRVTIKTLFLIALLYPVILLMSLSGCYSGLSWFTLYVTVRNVFDVIFWLVTTTLLYALLKFAQQFVAATISLEFIPAHLDFTKAAAFALLAISLGLTSFGSEKYLVGVAWHDVLSGKAKKYDQIQSENYRTIFDSEESLVTLKYPGFPRALVNFQGNYIKFDSTDNTLYVSKEVVRFFKKHEIVYAYDELPSERDVYTQEKRR
ncbi:MAG: hypothetical protein II921_10425, partial [Treponema sp.]|nr:hypothetical protein [Treponema sp.]